MQDKRTIIHDSVDPAKLLACLDDASDGQVPWIYFPELFKCLTERQLFRDFPIVESTMKQVDFLLAGVLILVKRSDDLLCLFLSPVSHQEVGCLGHYYEGQDTLYYRRDGSYNKHGSPVWCQSYANQES